MGPNKPVLSLRLDLKMLKGANIHTLTLAIAMLHVAKVDLGSEGAGWMDGRSVGWLVFVLHVCFVDILGVTL